MNITAKTGFSALLGRLAAYPRLRQLSWLLLPVVAGVSFLAISAGSPPVIPPVVLSSDPLYSTPAGDKPVLALSLSVEFPTVGAQYVDVPNTNLDNSYANTKEYLGYYDAESCYAYNDAPTETPVAPQTAADYKRFGRVGAAVTRMCNTSFPNAFSGNFLNWASNSAIDMMRLALTGGDRYVDTSSLTILQRAVLPNEDPICMWNSNNFPAKQLRRPGGTSGSIYFGAVPAAMATAAGINDIWVGNTLDRIYFRAAAGSSGGCTTTPSRADYALGVRQSWRGTPTTYGSKPAGWPATAVAVRGANGILSGGGPTGDGVKTIALAGVQEVLFGSGTDWRSMPASGVFTCSNIGFGGTNVSTTAECFVRAYVGAQTPPAAPAGTLTNYPFFYARVQACNSTSGVLADVRNYGPGYDYCKQYPSGNFKPSGAIQKYSDQLRLAAFGYLMDQTQSASGGRYGGVLRAPVKYVGAKTFDINGVENTPTGGNPNREWDETTGVFNVNPENDVAYGKSGVITYLNQFGRTGPTPGLYKKYDPIGELHFETVRYLQGLQPSPAAFSGTITPAMYDGFPAATTWVDPYGGGRSSTGDYSCLKSNIVTIGDINTWDGNRFPSTADPANNIPKISDWRDTVRQFEAATAGSYLDGAGVSRSTAGHNPTPNGASPSSADRSMIMGSAYWARTHDIRGTNWTGPGGPAKQRPGLRVKTFIFDVNEYGTSGPVGARRTTNQLFMAAKYGGFETSAANGNLTNPLAFNTQGNTFKRDNGTADKYVWEDDTTARAGEANTYYLQSDARGVLSAFDEIFGRAGAAARSIAGAAVQSKSLTTQVGNAIYQGTFNTNDWTGDLLAIPVSVNGSNTVSISTTPTWTASALLTSRNLTSSARKIVVGNAGATANPVAAPFLWAAPIGTAGIEQRLRDDLDKAAPAALADGLAQDRLNYLRGDRSREASFTGGVFRTRTGLLGDIVNSGVAYSGAPTTGINASGYATFYAANLNRTKAVFVGANDGMLHAFDAGSSSTGGQELFAYIPSWMGPKLSALTTLSYASNHQSYVDGTPVVSEAYVDGSSPAWKTVLVSGTGAGGQGVFALDVTNPAAFDATKVMWEFTHADDPDMGNVIGRPQILKMRTSAVGAAATYKWFAVVAGGVNSYVGTSGYGSGYPALFLLDLAKAAGTPWTLGTNYYKISLPVNGNLNFLTSGTLTATTATGLVNFKHAVGSAGEVTQMYMGDLHGNLWKLDFTLHGVANWNIGKLSSFLDGIAPSTIPMPMFIAKDTAGNRQPITMSPSIAFGPVPYSSYVLFGTGKFLELPDKTNNAVQSAYMVYDNGSSNVDTLIGVRESGVSGRVRLKRGTVNVGAGTVAVPAFTLGRGATAVDSETIRSGWYFDFPTSGERQISNGSIVGTKALFGSLIPAVTPTTGTCSVLPGGGYGYIVDIGSGNGVAVVSNVGILGEPIPFELPPEYTPTDSTGRRIKTVTTTTGFQGSLGVAVAGAGGTFTTTVAAGRLSWRQINNYLDLKAAP